MSEFKSFSDFRNEQHIPPDAEAQPSEEAESVLSEEPVGGGPPPSGKKIKIHIRWAADKRIYIAVCVFLLLAAGIVFLLPIPFGSIRLDGAETVTMEDICIDGGLKSPINVMQISTADLQKRLNRDVRLESVSVKREFPAVISIQVKERRILTIAQSEFGYVYLDETGTTVAVEPSIRKMEVPLITGKKLSGVLLGDKVDDDDVMKAIAFVGGLDKEGTKFFSEINIGNPQSIVAYTRDGIAVRLGEGDNMAQRAALAVNMVRDVRARNLNVEYIDANLASPYIRLKK